MKEKKKLYFYIFFVLVFFYVQLVNTGKLLNFNKEKFQKNFQDSENIYSSTKKKS